MFCISRGYELSNIKLIGPVLVAIYVFQAQLHAYATEAHMNAHIAWRVQLKHYATTLNVDPSTKAYATEALKPHVDPPCNRSTED